MTGMDVLRRCRNYERDMERLKLRIMCAKDAVLQCTRSMDMTSYGGVDDKMGRYAAKVDGIEREMEDRRIQYLLDVELAAGLLARLEPMQGKVLHQRMILGVSVKETAVNLHISCDSVRGLYRRGCGELEEIEVG